VTELGVAASFDIPIAEVSGLALRAIDGGLELLAVGDATSELARARLSDGVPGGWRVTRIAGVKDKKGSQLEAVAVDPAGRILLLRESPPAIFRLDEAGEAVECELTRDLSGDPAWAEVPRDDPNSMGEGLVVGPDGEAVLAKEKRPSALLHGALVGDVAVLHRHWLVLDDLAQEVADVSDLTFGPDGRLYLLSDRSSVIVRLEAGWRDADAIRADALWALPPEVEKAEGLVVLPDGRALVAVDHKKAKENLFLLEPPIT
jgi:Esterase-like activity of phytase